MYPVSYTHLDVYKRQSLLIVWVGGHQIADSARQVGDMMALSLIHI